MQTINYLNLRQTAVIELDQLLYAIAKRIQWLLPNKYGHRKVFLMLGALNIEMVMLGCLGDLLEDSGWTFALSNSGITSPRNDAFLTVHDVAKTKYMHQVTALALHQLMVSSYDKYIESKSSTDPPNFGEWKTIMESAYPQFQFWSIALNMVVDYLIFLRSIRTGDFKLYTVSLERILPWIFVFDHIHYSRWLPVHHQDMKTLRENNNVIYEEFVNNGNFVVHRTRNPFSAMDLTSDTKNSIKMLKVIFTDSLDLITSITKEAQKYMTDS